MIWASTHQAGAAQTGILTICPIDGMTERGTTFEPGGVILTAFDRTSLWVYDIDRNRRYPLPETFPCTSNCQLSPDARWFAYFNDMTNAFNQMRLDGTERSLIVEYASRVEWWSPDTWLIWTPGRQAYLREGSSDTREYLEVRGVVSIQPGGLWGLRLESDGEGFRRMLINLADRSQQIDLGTDLAYYNDYAWSPDGHWLAYVEPVSDNRWAMPVGSELFLIAPSDGQPVQQTKLTDRYGTARINGLRMGDLSWSPDGRHIAFWVTDLTGLDPVEDAGNTTLHVLDVDTQQLREYCHFTTPVNTPNPPRLAWSPDSSHIAFGADLPDDDRPAMLLALNVETGVFTILSQGVYPTFGAPDVAAWGLPPR